jgi:hypothetical protein
MKGKIFIFTVQIIPHMKKIFLALIITMGFAQMSYSQAAPLSGNKAVISFTKVKHDFKVIPQTKPVTYTFVFTNTGKEPLVVSNATASCGCTVPEFTKEPVKAGGKGSIKVTYNAAALGSFTKSITITSNATQPTIILTITGEVKIKKTASPALPSTKKVTSAPVRKK